jgi:transcriptional regulator with XRE-family HTH domain
MSQQVLADRVGVARAAVSNYENGTRAVDSRKVLYALAQALGVEVGALTGHHQDRANPGAESFTAAMADIELALMTVGNMDAARPPRPLPVLSLEAQRALQLRTACDYASLGALLPGLLTDLYRHTQSGVHQAWVPLAVATLQTAVAVKARGNTPLAWIAACACNEAAEQAGDIAGIGAAEFAKSQVLLARPGSLNAALACSTSAASRLENHAKKPGELEALGMLHLQSSLVTAALGGTPGAHLDEAAAVAKRKENVTGATQPAMGVRMPTFDSLNVGIWRMSAANEQREGGKAVELARTTAPGAITASSRRAQFFVELGRGQVLQRNYQEAIYALLRAEQTAPQQARSMTVVREIVGQMMRKARRDLTTGDLGKLAQRVGAIPA